MVPHRTRDTNSSRLRESLQAGRDIDGIAEEIVALHDDVADVQPDAETHLHTGGPISVLLCHGVLHRDSTLHGIDGADEIGDEAIASRVEDPTAMRGDQAVDDGSVTVESAERADLISLHESAVAFDIGCEDRGELPFDRTFFQGSAPPGSSIARPTTSSEGRKPSRG